MLAEGSVLKFIHQQMPDTVVQTQGQIRRLAGATQRKQRGLGNPGEINRPPFSEDQLQLCRGHG